MERNDGKGVQARGRASAEVQEGEAGGCDGRTIANSVYSEAKCEKPGSRAGEGRCLRWRRSLMPSSSHSHLSFEKKEPRHYFTHRGVI